MAHRYHQDRPRKCDADRAYLRAERRRARRRDRQTIRETRDWDLEDERAAVAAEQQEERESEAPNGVATVPLDAFEIVG